MRLFSLILIALATLATPVRTLSNPRSASSSTPVLTSRARGCPPSQIVAQYYPDWTNQSPAQIEWGYADLAFLFVVVTTPSGFAWPDASKTWDFLGEARKHGKKPLVTIGGWTGSRHFSDLVSTSARRATLARNLASLVNTYGFAGVDIDWEYPGQAGEGHNSHRPEDSENFLRFLSVLRSAVGSSKLITGAHSSVGITGSDGQVLADLSPFAAFFDYIVIMDYDMGAILLPYGSWSASTGPNAALRQCNAQSDSVEASVSLWISRGFPSCQILLGVPSYSHIFKTATSQVVTTTFDGMSSKAFQTLDHKHPASDPSYTYKQLISKGWLRSDGKAGVGNFRRFYDTCSQTPFLFSAYDRLFITYDDATSIGAKATYARSRGLGGVAFYSSDGVVPSMLAAARQGLQGSDNACEDGEGTPESGCTSESALALDLGGRGSQLLMGDV